MGACPAKPVAQVFPEDVQESDDGGRKFCKPLPVITRPKQPVGPLKPLCPEKVVCPCSNVKETVALEARKPPALVSRPCGIRKFLEQEKEPDDDWRSIIEEILQAAEPCPPPPQIAVVKEEQCFQLPKPPPPEVPDWKTKCAEVVKSFTSSKQPFPSDFGPGGDSCMQKGADNQLDPSVLWENACSTRNEMMETKNALTARYNSAAKEVEQLMQESNALRQHLMSQRCSVMSQLMDQDKTEVHLGEAIQMARDAVSFNEWEIRQLDELLDTLTLASVDSKKRAGKVQINYDFIKKAMPGVISQIKDCRSVKKAAMTDLTQLVGEMGGMLDICLRRPIHNWRTLRKILKPALAVFLKAMEDYKCASHGAPPDYLIEFLDASFSYADDSDALERFIEDKTLMTHVHDMDMIFEFLTSLAKNAKDEGMVALQVADQKETLRPWNQIVSDKMLTRECSLLPKSRPPGNC